ncbi:MAG TPA: chemotaxis protein CheW [Anaeromyxobacteraceae bacterium]|nr:chemotaxis protein CheW [Anaeromyxobacteraceae bacterium]
MPEPLRVCTFLLGGKTFALPVGEVREVVKDLAATPVPLAPPAVLGLVHLRGQIATAVDLRRRLDLDPFRPERPHVNVVVQGADGLVCLPVDDIGDVIDIPADAVDRPPDTLRPAVRELVRAICKLQDELVLLLDTARAVDPSP